MRTSFYAPFYDLFKLIVAILLLVIFLVVLWRVTPPSPAPPSATWTPHPPSSETAAVSSTPPPPTDTASPTLNPALVTLTATPTPPSAESLTPTPSPTLPPVTETLPTPIVEIPSDPNACAAISRSRLQAGMRATILRRLNFRSSPGIMNNWILTNLPGTQVEVIGGPACTIYENGGSYLWWQIKLPNGVVGWSAEASAFGAFYFMEPSR